MVYKQIERDKDRTIQIQVKDKNGHSRSFTIHGETVGQAYGRITFLYDELARTEESVTIKHYKKNGGTT